MVKSVITIGAFLLILFLISYPYHAALTPSTGWHTTIFLRSFVLTLFISILALFAIIGYCILSRRNDKVNRALLISHIILTIVPIIFMDLPFIYVLFVQPPLYDDMLRGVIWWARLKPAAWSTALMAQGLFFVYFFRTLKNRL